MILFILSNFDQRMIYLQKELSEGKLIVKPNIHLGMFAYCYEMFQSLECYHNPSLFSSI